jgi:hypothetical protein
MRLIARVLPTLLFTASFMAFAQDEAKNDLLRDGLAGPVRSVAATRLSEASKQEMRNIEFGFPAGCAVCEYDRDGNKITSGRMAEGVFEGQRTLIQHNQDGMVERITSVEWVPTAHATSPASLVTERELDGAFGPVDTTVFQTDGSVLIHVKREYDSNGHVSQVWSFDSNGVMTSHEIYRWTDDGQRKEQAVFGKGDTLSTRMTWNPDTDESRYTCFDPSGALLETWGVAHGKVLSFWEASDGQGECHEHLMFDEAGNGEFIRYFCQKSTGCRVEHSYSQYAGSGKQNIRHTDFRDSAGQLKWTSDFEYEFDSNGNWTHRKVWVTFPDGGRVLSSEDARILTYWDK